MLNRKREMNRTGKVLMIFAGKFLSTPKNPAILSAVKMKAYPLMESKYKIQVVSELNKGSC